MRSLSIPGVFAPRWQKKFEAFASDKRGLAAVEFAMIAVPFFFLIFGLLEVCVIFIMSSILEHGANEAARAIKTGQFQQAGFDEATFKASVCSELFGLMTCDDKLSLDVKTFSNFGGTGDPSPIDASGELDDSGFGFNPGAQNEIVVVRVFYEWDLLIPVMSAPLANMSNSRRLLQATIAFRNEPFGNSSASGT
ncbi:MAG: TadE/TadG family type IV pilus assembly protein [Henriciella sp.]